jgi:hypothetical protein
MTNRFDTREEYLAAALDEMRRTLFPVKVPERVRVSCGFPKGSRGGRKAIGQAWTSACSQDGTFELFVSPVLSGDDPVTVLGVLVHEVVHTVVGLAAGHKSPFKRLAEEIGLTGKMTATYPGEDLSEYLGHLSRHLGRYPHGSLIPGAGMKKDGTRLVKLECPGCGYILRTTAKWIETGLPTCCCGEEFQLA